MLLLSSALNIYIMRAKRNTWSDMNTGREVDELGWVFLIQCFGVCVKIQKKTQPISTHISDAHTVPDWHQTRKHELHEGSRWAGGQDYRPGWYVQLVYAMHMHCWRSQYGIWKLIAIARCFVIYLRHIDTIINFWMLHQLVWPKRRLEQWSEETRKRQEVWKARKRVEVIF